MSRGFGDVLCFGEDWYKASFSSAMQIALRLGRGRRLLWINPLAVRVPSLAGSRQRRAFLRKALHKLRSHLRYLRRARAGVWVLSPLYLPLFLSERGDRLNAALLAWQVRLACAALGLRRPLILATATYPAHLAARRLPRHAYLYYFADKMSAFTDLPPESAEAIRERYRRYDRQICAEADRVYCASLEIHRDLAARAGEGARVAYLPHGVDFAHFAGARERGLPLPEPLRGVRRPVVGYFGSLTEHNNKAILRRLLERHPDWTLLLIGSVVGDYRELARFPNCLMPGAVPYAELPAWAQVFDVGILNWHETEWIAGSFPLKVQEYLALGIPVVSVRIRELQERFAGLVRIADGEEDFVRLVEEELAADDADKRRRRAESVRDRDWARVVERIHADLGELAP